MYETIVVGTDGSPTATVAVDRAARLACRLGARLVVVTGHEPGAPGRVSSLVDQILADARRRCAAAGADVDTRAVLADPAVALIDVAAELPAALIVVGNRRASGGMRLLTGSVPNRVLRRAPCDVVVAKTDAARAGELPEPRPGEAHSHDRGR